MYYAIVEPVMDAECLTDQDCGNTQELFCIKGRCACEKGFIMKNNKCNNSESLNNSHTLFSISIHIYHISYITIKCDI